MVKENARNSARPRARFPGIAAQRADRKNQWRQKIYGMSDAHEGSRWFYNRVAKVNRHGYAVNRYLKLAECIGANVGEWLRCPLPTGEQIEALTTGLQKVSDQLELKRPSPQMVDNNP